MKKQFSGDEPYGPEEIKNIIDNAPAVVDDNFSLGYQFGVRQALNARPQGEWIKEQVTPASCTYVCSECGIEEVILSNFCRYCGADMRKGGKEE